MSTIGRQRSFEAIGSELSGTGVERTGSFQEAVGDAAVLGKDREKGIAREGLVASA